MPGKMDVGEGFTSDYSIDDTENVADINIGRTGKVTANREIVLASLTVRVCELKTGYTYEEGANAGRHSPAGSSRT